MRWVFRDAGCHSNWTSLGWTSRFLPATDVCYFPREVTKNESYTSGTSCLKNPSLLQDAVGLLLEAGGKRTRCYWKNHPRQLFAVDLHPEVQVEMCTPRTLRDFGWDFGVAKTVSTVPSHLKGFQVWLYCIISIFFPFQGLWRSYLEALPCCY